MSLSLFLFFSPFILDHHDRDTDRRLIFRANSNYDNETARSLRLIGKVRKLLNDGTEGGRERKKGSARIVEIIE